MNSQFDSTRFQRLPNTENGRPVVEKMGNLQSDECCKMNKFFTTTSKMTRKQRHFLKMSLAWRKSDVFIFIGAVRNEE